MMTMLMATPNTEQEIQTPGIPALFGTRYRMRGSFVKERGMIALTDAGVMLVDGNRAYGYTPYGESIDATIDEQLAWEEVPEDVDDAHAYAVRVAYENRAADYGREP